MEGEGNFPEASSIRFLVSSYRWTKPRSAAFPPVSQADQRHEPTHHKAAHLSGQRHNPSCVNSMSQLPPYAQPGGLQTRGANSPRMGNLSRPNHRPTGHGKRPGRSDRRGYDGHSKLDLCPDLSPRPLPRSFPQTFAQTGEQDFLYYTMGRGDIWRRHILACMTCGDPRLVLMRLFEGGMSRERTYASGMAGLQIRTMNQP